MFSTTPFYFNLIRKYVITFGTLFNNIYITRTDAAGNKVDYMRVPVIYGPKDKALARVVQDPNIDRPTAVFPLPMMSFEISGFRYDAARKLQTINRSAYNDPDDKSKRRYQWNPVPYNIDFELSILVKNAEDGTKIVEQILPYFTPDWTVTALLIPEMDIKHDIPIILNSVNLDDVYDGDFTNRRSMIWTLTFTLKGYMYGPVKSTKIIKYANTQFFAPENVENLRDAVGNIDDQVVAFTTIQPGLLANGSPTSNGSLSIPVDEIIATDDYGFVITRVDPAGPTE
jgi:hypothetical protein